jgi:hypothetical protein
MELFMISKNILDDLTSVSIKRTSAHPIVASDTLRVEMKRGLAMIAAPFLSGTPFYARDRQR